MARLQVKLMRKGVIPSLWDNLMNLGVEEEQFKSVVWRALNILKRSNPTFHFEVYSEGELICEGSNHMKVKERKE